MASDTKTKGKEKHSTKTVPNISIRIQKLFDVGSLRAVASANIGGAFAVHGIKVIDSEKGLFVSMPSNQYTKASGETKYQDVFHPVTTEARQKLNDAVLAAYQQAVAESETEVDSMDESPTQSM